MKPKGKAQRIGSDWYSPDNPKRAAKCLGVSSTNDTNIASFLENYKSHKRSKGTASLYSNVKSALLNLPKKKNLKILKILKKIDLLNFLSNKDQQKKVQTNRRRKQGRDS